MGEVGLIPANLATVCIESFFYGIFFTLSTVSFYLLYRRQKGLGAWEGGGRSQSDSRSRNAITILLVSSALIFFSNTVHWTAAVARPFEAFVYYKGGNAPLDFYADLSQPTEVVQSAATIFTIVVYDAMIIYRLWIVWAFNKRVVMFPLCTLVGLTVCGVGTVYQMTTFRLGENVFVTALGRWLNSSCAFSLCTNVYSTTMIAWRIWRINSAIVGYRHDSLMSVMATVVESAVLYTIWTIFFLVTYETQSNLQFVTNETLPFVAGISFMLINVRVGMGWAQNGTATTSTFVDTSGTSASGNQSFAMRPLAVNITSTVHKDHESDDVPVKYFSHGSSDLMSAA
ncbi:uncharacterized protein LAESUDRAFT_655097 [Laetiporus sulphureus 93-53]|uniref:Uncharacterized protein n=1 Tax=Laetiporus sulphureus 93-53 TaxID=1314785 RepID=A0A165DWU5_9APHY|nr:uncharacterized protein LAESUDRAFT_655097 [Laetiporus sulphureus 93-53]KZT05791.1 hypothetical protein LAESUDRAFT_655097 [Laetiporus sulphureus 93-53]